MWVVFMTQKEIFELLKTKEYDFLRENENLGQSIGMLCLGGSLAYGTNLPNHGDVDLRGFAFEKPSQIIGLTPSFGQVVETTTDTTIYAFNKFIGLLLDNNPNTIELLGCKPEHYFYLSEVAKELIKNRKIFLSKKRIIRSFGGYANQQLNRLENAIARDRLTQSKKEEHIRVSMENAIMGFEDRYSHFDKGGLRLYTDVSDKEGYDSEVYLDIDLKRFPVREFSGIINELTNISRQYGKLNHRNSKKDFEHLDKHAMHLLRLYYMAFDLLENGEINTYREKERDFLLSVRQGKFRKEDGTYSDEFFELRKEMDERFQRDMKESELPEEPDMKKVNELVMWANSLIVKGDI